MAETQKIVILDFGGQYTQLIARRVRECRVYSEVLPYNASCGADSRHSTPWAMILSGGPASVLEEGAPRCDLGVWELGVPVLGICYGMQLTAHLLGGKVEKGLQAGIRPHPCDHGRPGEPAEGHERILQQLDEPYLPGEGVPAWLPCHCPRGKLPCGGHGEP